MRILLRTISFLSGALSIWVELHFFYTILNLLSLTLEQKKIMWFDMEFLPSDLIIFSLSLFLCEYIQEGYPMFAKRGGNQDETEAHDARRSNACA